ncbi:hypothetical protein SDC9_208466 [bioreactor metagenome]|uniref:Uncharacterized protein n=1 Tax=bioreactor metagenome TaxID=1076179 RepID=A0A645JAN5_9ZZZZ
MIGADFHRRAQSVTGAQALAPRQGNHVALPVARAVYRINITGKIGLDNIIVPLAKGLCQLLRGMRHHLRLTAAPAKGLEHERKRRRVGQGGRRKGGDDHTRAYHIQFPRHAQFITAQVGHGSVRAAYGCPRR